MRMNKLVTLMIVVAVLLSACGGPTPTKGEVIVYVAAPLSGFQANGGQTVLGGARLAAETGKDQCRGRERGEEATERERGWSAHTRLII